MFPAAHGLVARAVGAALTERDGSHGAHSPKANSLHPAVAGGLVSLLVIFIYAVSMSVRCRTINSIIHDFLC